MAEKLVYPQPDGYYCRLCDEFFFEGYEDDYCPHVRAYLKAREEEDKFREELVLALATERETYDVPRCPHCGVEGTWGVSYPKGTGMGYRESEESRLFVCPNGCSPPFRVIISRSYVKVIKGREVIIEETREVTPEGVTVRKGTVEELARRMEL